MKLLFTVNSNEHLQIRSFQVDKKKGYRSQSPKTMFIKLLFALFSLQLFVINNHVNALVEDVIDILHLGREVIKTISNTWELADQAGVTSDIDLPFMKRKEKKILSRMAELTQEFRNAEMNVRELCDLQSALN
jgi:hypothetical protein